jgi:hypothetical protein
MGACGAEEKMRKQALGCGLWGLGEVKSKSRSIRSATDGRNQRVRWGKSCDARQATDLCDTEKDVVPQRHRGHRENLNVK